MFTHQLCTNLLTVVTVAKEMERCASPDAEEQFSDPFFRRLRASMKLNQRAERRKNSYMDVVDRGCC
jgi:hypothetical protein